MSKHGLSAGLCERHNEVRKAMQCPNGYRRGKLQHIYFHLKIDT